MENTNSVSFLKSTTTRRLRPDEIKFTQLAFDREQTVGFCGGNTGNNKGLVDIHPTTDTINDFKHNTSPQSSI